VLPYGTGAVLTAQSGEGLHDDPAERDRLLNSASTLAAHRLADPDLIVTRAGTIRKAERSHQLDATGATGAGSLRIQDAYRIDPTAPDIRPLPVDGEQLPLALDPLERMASPVGEAQAGAGHQVVHRSRDEDLTGTGEALDARGEMDGDSGHVGAGDLAFAGVESGPDLQFEAPHAVADDPGALYRPAWRFEGGQEAVAGGLDLPALPDFELSSDQGVMALEDLPPAGVADAPRRLGGADDVREEHGGQDAVCLG
jgi:hypothetical protein